jgi:hypothetical protein
MGRFESSVFLWEKGDRGRNVRNWGFRFRLRVRRLIVEGPCDEAS